MDKERVNDLIEGLPTRTRYLMSRASRKDRYMWFYILNKSDISNIIGIHDDPVSGNRHEQAHKLELVRKRLQEYLWKLG